mgnify:FL=1|tara:strand:- start:6249 stop:8672 length:2424 start_codon:yes stop_codon:yes gene_type:complete
MGEGIVLKYKNIAEIINILREKTVIEDAAEKLRKYNQQLAGVDFGSDRPLGEFTEDDAKQFVKDIAKEATLDPSSDKDLEYIRQNLFPHFVYNDGDFSVGPDGVFKIKSVSFPEDLENVDLLFPSQGADKFFVNHQLEVFENPKYIKNADFLALTLGEAKKDEFNFVTEEMARTIFNVVKGITPIDEKTTLLDPDTGEIQDFALAGIDENKVLNWLQAWDDKLFVLKEYLRNGKLLDERGEYTLEVPNFVSGDYESSMTALFQFEIDNPSRILTGDSLISQYDNTFTDRKRRQLQDLRNKWGVWNPNDSIGNNVKKIMKGLGYDPNDKAANQDSDLRWSMGYVQREEVIEPLTDYLAFLEFEEGSEEYLDAAIEKMLELTGEDLELANAKVGQTYEKIAATPWDTNTRSGRDNALALLLDQLGYKSDEIDSEDFIRFSNELDGVDSFSDAFNDEVLATSIQSSYEKHTQQTEADQRRSFNTPNNLANLVKEQLRTEGYLGLNSTEGFENLINSKAIPEIVRRIANAGGADNEEDLRSLVADLTSRENMGTDQGLPAYLLDENMYLAQVGPTGFPTTDPNLTGEPPSIMGLRELLGTRVQQKAPTFSKEEVDPILQELAVERPEFYAFVTDQMGTSQFAEAWRQASVPQVDEVAISREVGGGPQEGSVDYERNVKRLETFQQQYADIVNQENLTEEQVEEAAARLQQEVSRFERETGTDAITREKRAVGEAFQTGGAFKRAAVDKYTTPGLTSEEFLKGRLAGFETRFEASPFFKLEQDRVQQEEERKRRTRLTATGPARTIVRRGRR